MNRKDTFNKTTNQFEFPQTPARVQLSIWPGGKETNAKGTIDWAGGVIDWNHEDIKNVGYFYAAFESVEIECYQTNSPPGTNKGKSYWYDDIAGTNDTVKDGNKDTVMGSFLATGLNPDEGKKEKDDKDDKKDKDKDDKDDKKAPAQIPGGGNGATGKDHSDADKDNSKPDSSDDSTDTSSSGSGDASPPDPKNCDVSSFHSDCSSKSASKDSDKSTDGGNGEGAASRSGASALAVIIAVCALFWL